MTSAAILPNRSLRHATFLISTLKFLNQVLLFFWGVYFTQIHLSGYQQGILLAIYPIIGILSVIPIGFLNDRTSSKNLITVGFALVSLQYLLLTQSEHFFWITGALVVGSFGTVMTKISLDSFFYKNSDHEKTQEVGNYVGSYLLGAGLGIILGGHLLEALSFHQVFKIVFGMGMAVAMLSLALPKGPKFHIEWKGYREDLFQPKILLFMSVMFLWATHMGSETTSYGLYLREDLGLSYTGMGLFMGSAIAAMFFWSRLASHLHHRKIDIFRILFWGLFLSAMGELILTSPNLWFSYAGRCLHEVGDAFMFVFFYNGVRKFFPKERAGGSAGVLNFGEMVAIILSSVLLAPLGKLYGNAVPLWIGAGCIFLALPMAYAFARVIRKHPKGVF